MFRFGPQFTAPQPSHTNSKLKNTVFVLSASALQSIFSTISHTYFQKPNGTVPFALTCFFSSLGLRIIFCYTIGIFHSYKFNFSTCQPCASDFLFHFARRMLICIVEAISNCVNRCFHCNFVHLIPDAAQMKSMVSVCIR